jgi:Leucine-rich repeat (LRR) protein
MDSLDLSNNPFLVDLSPLQMVDKLKYLSIDNVRTEDFSPLRYLSKLNVLSASGCGLTSLEHLKYARDLQALNLSKNPLADSLDWMTFSNVQQLSIAETGLMNYKVLGQMTKLEKLDAQGNMDITSVNQFPAIPSLKELGLTKTNISSLDGISAFPSLERLIAAGTPLSEIGAASLLKGLSYLDIQNFERTQWV